MRLFDLHCDTIEELKKRGEDYLNCTTQFSLRDREKFQKAVQVMAVFVPDDIRGQEAVQFVLDYHQYMDDQVRRTGGQAELVEKSRTWTGYWMRENGPLSAPLKAEPR